MVYIYIYMYNASCINVIRTKRGAKVNVVTRAYS